ncbi:MAG: hypothetical protein IT436_16720 [Phycisphaerales bacterium]|nr:hypothetical protein [Phycisphaerales bacterium]
MAWIADLMKDNAWLPIIMVVGSLIAIMAIVSEFTRTARARAFEKSRREIAAYVAEGSISAEQAAALLAIGPEGKAANDPSIRLAQAVAWGSVDKEDASQLVEAREGIDEDSWKQMVDLVLEGMSTEDAIKLARSKRATA